MIYDEVKGDILLEPYISISPRSISLYRKAYDMNRTCYIRKYVDRSENLRDNRIKSGLSEKAKARIRKCIDFMELTSEIKTTKHKNGEYKWKLNFLTLHLPAPQFSFKESGEPVQKFRITEFEKGLYIQNFTDKDVKSKCLNQFLTELRQTYGVKDYIWKAETQENGNIHFHLTTNVYLPAMEIRDIWNRCLNKLKMVDYYHGKFSKLDFKQYCNYRKSSAMGRNLSLSQLQTAFSFGVKTNWQSPNTTDIHSTKKVKNMAAYLTEYICKNTPDSRLIDGRLWFLSKSLTSYKNKVVAVTDEIRAEIGQFLIDVKKTTYTVFNKITRVYEKKNVVDRGEYVWLFKVPYYRYLENGMNLLHQIFTEHLTALRQCPELT